MYLKTIRIENARPIADLSFDLPFEQDRPLPLVLVGPNGSGKSTLLSFIVNSLLCFKQQAFDSTEVEHGKVYRMRSARFIRNGASWYHTNLHFEEGMEIEEWTLDRPRKEFEEQVSQLPAHDGWKKVADDAFNYFAATPSPSLAFQRTHSRPIQKLLAQNVVLYFPSDRFELPNWLNESALADELRFPEPTRFEGHTSRRILARTLLKPTLEWVKAVVLDKLLHERTFHYPGNDEQILAFVGMLLARIFGADDDKVSFNFSHRNVSTISIQYVRCGNVESVPSLFGMSAGQATLFCAFCNVIRDFDMAGTPFNNTSEVRGIVMFDEADLHLHVDLQYRVLPELMKQFPKVQFILTAHSPLLVMGMRNIFGEKNFQVREMPSGQQIDTENFSELKDALSAFTRVQEFDRLILRRIQNATKPLVITEGKTDVAHITVAWAKLYGNREIPFEVISCGGIGIPKEDRGGAEMLRTMLRACCLHSERQVVGLFDHDREGMEQFFSLKSDGFVDGEDNNHRQHVTEPIHALVLPVPSDREFFVSMQPRSCFLALEHYYSDRVLDQSGVKDQPVVADSSVFSINSKKKSKFAETVANLPSTEFGDFRLLFERLLHLFKLQDSVSTPPAAPDQSFSTTFTTNDQVAQTQIEYESAPITAGAENLSSMQIQTDVICENPMEPLNSSEN